GTVTLFTDANPSDTPANFTASINWGDGTSSSGTVLAYGTSFVVQGMHTYGAAGPFTLNVLVTKIGRSTVPATGSVHIAGPVTPPSTLSAVASALTHSTEYFGNIVNFAYEHYLHRAPDVAGYNNWVSALFNHQIIDEQLEAFFVGSTEYINRFGT